MIQSFITITGTITMLLILSWRLSLIVIFFLACMTLFIRYNSRRNRKYFIRQQQCLGSINGFVEEMVAGQKVEKVFNHEPQDFEEFCRRNEALRDAGTKALAYSGMTIPTIVSLSYFNYAIFCLCGRPLYTGRPDGSGNTGLLSGLCAPERHAHEPVYPAD